MFCTPLYITNLEEWVCQVREEDLGDQGPTERLSESPALFSVKYGYFVRKIHQRVRSLIPVGDCERLWGHMQLRLIVPVFSQRSLLVVFCIVLIGCPSSPKKSAPTVA